MLYSLLEGISTDSLNEISFCANDSDLSQLKTAKSLVVEAFSKVTAPAFIVVFLRYRCLVYPSQSSWCGHCFTHHIVGGLSTALFKLWEYLSREATLQPCTCRSPWNAFRGGKERRLGCFQGRRLDPEHVTPKKRSCQWQDCYMRYFWVRSPKWGLGVVNLSRTFLGGNTVKQSHSDDESKKEYVHNPDQPSIFIRSSPLRWIHSWNTTIALGSSHIIREWLGCSITSST